MGTCPHIQCGRSEPPPPSWLGDLSRRPRQESVSETGSPSFLACHQSPSKGSPRSPLHRSLAKAKLRKHPPRICVVANTHMPISHQGSLPGARGRMGSRWPPVLPHADDASSLSRSEAGWRASSSCLLPLSRESSDVITRKASRKKPVFPLQ